MNELLRSRGNDSIKIITGIRRCGKSYLLKTLFKDHLLHEGIPTDHIIVIDLEDRKQAAFKDPDYLIDYYILRSYVNRCAKCDTGRKKNCPLKLTYASAAVPIRPTSPARKGEKGYI